MFCEKLRNQGLFRLGKGWVQGDLTAPPSAYGDVSKSQSQALYSGAQWEDKQQWA